MKIGGQNPEKEGAGEGKPQNPQITPLQILG